MFSYYTQSQRWAIIAMIVFVILLQIGLFFLPTRQADDFVVDQSAMTLTEKRLDSIAASKKYVLSPFNPNYITDYRAYVLGLSTAEVDRLQAFRAKNKYVNSAKEFQQVTQVSDEWLAKYKEYFKFPDFVQKSNSPSASSTIVRKNINAATYEDLVAINGIGDYSAKKIIQERDKFGGFVSTKQFRFIERLPANVYVVLGKNFTVNTRPAIVKIDINRANIDDLQKIPYINYKVARSIVVYRSKQDQPLTQKDLAQIPHFPLDKLSIISLYLGTSN